MTVSNSAHVLMCVTTPPQPQKSNESTILYSAVRNIMHAATRISQTSCQQLLRCSCLQCSFCCCHFVSSKTSETSFESVFHGTGTQSVCILPQQVIHDTLKWGQRGLSFVFQNKSHFDFWNRSTHWSQQHLKPHEWKKEYGPSSFQEGIVPHLGIIEAFFFFPIITSANPESAQARPHLSIK